MRHPDWETRLSEMIESVRGEPLVWGVHDCFTFINAAHYALKGEFLSPEWFCDYDTAYRAKVMYAKKIKETGFNGIIEGIDSKLDRQTGPIAPRGSISARPLEGNTVLGYAFGVVVSDKIAFLTADGLDFSQPVETDIFWSVE